jgi:hypothetical protein
LETVCCDFNINYLVDSNKNTIKLTTSVLQSLYMVKFPTRRSMTLSTIIDNIFTDSTMFKNIDIETITYY